MARVSLLGVIAASFLSQVSFATAPAPADAIEIFMNDRAVQSEISKLESHGYTKDADASASLFQYSWGDEGYRAGYLVSLPVINGNGPGKIAHILAGKVFTGYPKNSVEIIDTDSLEKAMRDLR